MSVVLGFDIRLLWEVLVLVLSACLSLHRLVRSAVWRDRLRDLSICLDLGGRRAPRGFMCLFCSMVICEWCDCDLMGRGQY